MQFTDKQRTAITKAVEQGYLNGMVPDEVRDWLLEVEPKNPGDASYIVGLVFAVAYGKGEEIEALPRQEQRQKMRDRSSARLCDLMAEYEKY